MSVLHRHKDKAERQIGLLDQLVQEFACLTDITAKLKPSHVFTPLNKLVFDHLDFLQEFHL